MRLSLIVAVAENGCIGREGDLPWKLPEDLKRFKQITLGHPVLMGRKTYESIGRPLPGRQNIIISRQQHYAAPGCDVVHTLAEALATAEASGADEAFIIGGAALYADTLPQADRLYITRVRACVEGDVFLPGIPPGRYTQVSAETHPADDRHAHAFTFEVWDRIPVSA